MLDNQAFPYGNKKESFIIKRTINIINIVKKKYPIRIVVVACNTASTISLSILRKKFSFPIFGVLPRIESDEKIKNKKIIGLIATVATIKSSYVKETIKKKYSNSTLKIIGTNKLALIAEKKMRGYANSTIELKKIFKSWINLSIKPDIIILGCTHFSFLKKEIKTILNNNNLCFIDSIKIITHEINDYFKMLNFSQNINKNVLLYSGKNKKFKQLLFFLKKYKFTEIKNIILN